MTAPHSNDVPKSDLVATLADLEPVQIPSGVDLNDYDSTGRFHQGSDASAQAGTNYPVPHGGYLDVVKDKSGTMVYQSYRTYGTLNKVYTRSRYAGGWGPWKELSTVGHTHSVAGLDASGRTNANYLRGDGTWATPTNTTYSVMSEAEATAGTATTARTTSAAGLKGAIQRWATGTYSTAISSIGQALNRAANAADARSAIGAAADNHTHTQASLGAVARSGSAATLWSGTAVQYAALADATKNAAGFVAVIVD